MNDLQEELEVMIGRLPLEHNEGIYSFVKWLKRFSEVTDNFGIVYDKSYVVEQLLKLGYRENDYVGWKGSGVLKSKLSI